jgi:quercetin dioxygenase-like cupin family protein
MVTPDEANWGAAPPGLPAGAEVAVLEGDPSAAGPFTMRAKFPDGYTIPPHFHPADEHVTVLQGTFLMGMGERLSNSAMKELTASSFAVMPKGTAHFAQAKGETIVQVHGIGPWAITYVNPSDDPRSVKK